ncbi:MAG: hypothetical protein AAF437_11785 [Pseudomonadota bacterium]
MVTLKGTLAFERERLTNRAEGKPNRREVGGAFDNSSNNTPHPKREVALTALDGSSISMETMIYRSDEARRRPLVIVNSIEFPMPPSVEFCELMWENNLQVIFVRRLGFGGTPGLPLILLQEQTIRSGAAVSTEAALLHQLIVQLGLSDVVLLGIGSGNPICYRLCRINPNIKLSIFSNAVFNQDSWIGFRPAWFRAVLRQTVMTKSGFKIAAQGLRHYLRQSSIRYYDQVFSKSEGDRKYISNNLEDARAAIDLMRNIGSETFYYDLTMSMRKDESLKDGYFKDVPAVAFSGMETTDEWLSETRREAARLSIPIAFAERGGMLVAYAAPEKLLQIIDSS